MFLIIDCIISVPYILSLLIALFIGRKDLHDWKMQLARIVLLFLSLPQIVIFAPMVIKAYGININYTLMCIIVAVQALFLWYLVNVLVYLKVNILSYAKKLFYKS